MSRRNKNIQWEYDLVERPFCEHLKLLGWQWIEGDTDVPELTERESFREPLLKVRLAAALRKINTRDGQQWLDGERINRIIENSKKPRVTGSWKSTSRRPSSS
jgi:type I restriction enzyme, R subunit